MKTKSLFTLLEMYEKDLQKDLWSERDEQLRAVSRFKAFALSSSDVFERTHLEGHFTASAFVISEDKKHLLMTHHKKLGKWLQLGGHADGEEELEKVALKECEEESGLTSLQFLPHPRENFTAWIFDLDDHQIPPRKEEPVHIHYDVRFLLIAKNTPLVISDESIDLQWIPLDRVFSYNPERSIMRCVEKIAKFLNVSV